MRRIFVGLIAILALGASTVSAFAARPAEFSNTDSVMRFVNEYRIRPEFERVPNAFRTLARFGALSGLGMIMRELGEDKRAIEAYQRALAVDPNLDGVQKALDELQTKAAGKQI